MLVIVRSGAGHRARGRHADAQLAALRLLPARSAHRRLRLPRDRPRDRRARSAGSSAGCSAQLLRLARPVHRLRDPEHRVRDHGLPAEGAGPRPLGASRGGRERRRSSTPTRSRRRSRSRSASCGRSARCAASGTRCRSSPAAFIGLVTLTSLYYEQVFGLGDFQRGFVAALAEPAQIVAILLGHPARDAADAARSRRRASACSPVVGIVIAHRVDRVRARARRCGSRSRCTVVDRRRSCRAARARHLRGALARDPAQGAIARASRWPRCSSCPACSSLYVVGGIADTYGIRAGLLIVGADLPHRRVDPRVGLDLREERHQPGVDVDRGAGRSHAQAPAGRGEAAARPQRRRALRQRAGAVPRRLRGRRRRDRRAARHERRRASRRCSRRSPASSRRRTARSCSTAAT